MFSFNMSALTTLLRKQAENNPSASYFNVDMIKYQVIVILDTILFDISSSKVGRFASLPQNEY